jgi:ABC-type phosphate/phosphonate transport system substrate-binding protein
MRPDRTKLAVFALGAALLLAPGHPLGAEPARRPATRKLAVVPFYAPELMWRLYTPLIEHLSRQTGEPWTLVLPATHAAFDDAVCRRKVDVALTGPVPLARINRRCGLLPFLVALGPDGKADYHSMLVTASPDVTSVAALRGRQVVFFKGSTAAHVVPVKMLAEAGLEPGSYEPLFVESQDRVMTMVLTGKAAAGGVKSALYRRFAGEPSLRLLQTSAPLPNFAFAALPSLPKAVRERFSAALLPLNPRARPADAQLVSGWDDELKAGFIAASDGFLPAASELLKATETLPRATR